MVINKEVVRKLDETMKYADWIYVIAITEICWDGIYVSNSAKWYVVLWTIYLMKEKRINLLMNAIPQNTLKVVSKVPEMPCS